MTAFLPVSFVHCALTASSAFLRLAAANTRTSDPCAAVGSPGAASSRRAVTPALATSNVRLERVIAIACTPNQPADWRIGNHNLALYSTKYHADLHGRIGESTAEAQAFARG